MQARDISNHEELMRRALAAAELGRGRTRPNPMVGCVIVKNGKILATGYHAKAGEAHAEVDALRKAGARARGADVYVTLEPCAHHGRVGPCTEQLIAAGVRRIYVGARDPNPRVNGRGLRRLRQAGLEVHLGILAGECRCLNEAFEHYITSKRPFVISKTAQSLDGRVATRTGESRWVTSEEARLAGHRLRNETDAIMVGVGTVLADDPELTCRLPRGRDPVRIIIDSQARTPAGAKLVRLAATSSAPTWLVTTDAAPTNRCRALLRQGVELILCKQRRGQVDLDDMLDQLGARELLTVLVEGGPTLLGSLFDAQLVNKVHSFVAPLIIGGTEARSAIGGRGAAHLADSVRLDAMSVATVGPDLLLTGYPRY
jgi:diaminohydroxyphosphoribosylaminopyrimidine deaminase / 5-amino-6-(5-phosphoribosylamino)uracil reductase